MEKITNSNNEPDKQPDFDYWNPATLEFPPGGMWNLDNEEQAGELERALSIAVLGNRKLVSQWAMVQFRCRKGCLLGAYGLAIGQVKVWIRDVHTLLLRQEIWEQMLISHETGEEKLNDTLLRIAKQVASFPEFDSLPISQRNEIVPALEFKGFKPTVALLNNLQELTDDEIVSDMTCRHLETTLTAGQLRAGLRKVKSMRNRTIIVN